MADGKYKCGACALAFTPRMRTQKWCSQECKPSNTSGKKVPVAFTCEFCGCSSARHMRSARPQDDALKFCSRACSGARRTKVRQERLALERIGARARAKPKAPRLQPHQGPYKLACAECGDTVVRAIRARAVCAPCYRLKQQASYKAYCRSGKGLEIRRASKKAYKVRRAGRTVVVETFSALSILKRDNWTCQLCGCATPRHLRGTSDDNAPEVDHIVPLALGGAHAVWNVQCACRLCNCLKGANHPTGGRQTLETA